MEKATLAFLRHLAFWNAAEKQRLSPAHPDVREVESKLAGDFTREFRALKMSDVN